MRSSKSVKVLSLLFKSFLFACLFLATNAKAQLSGTYTIGGSGPTYATLSAAIGDLTNNGVSGAVTFVVAAGTYNEHITIGKITGV